MTTSGPRLTGCVVGLKTDAGRANGQTPDEGWVVAMATGRVAGTVCGDCAAIATQAAHAAGRPIASTTKLMTLLLLHWLMLPPWPWAD